LITEHCTLYGAPISLYTGKVRSYLKKKGLPYEEVLSTVKVYKNLIIPRTGVRFIPVLQTPDDQVLQDTTVILDELESHHPDNSIYPDTPKQHLTSLLIETYAEEWLVIPAMHYRWNYPQQNSKFIYSEFGRVVFPKAPAFIRAWVGKKIGAKFKDKVPFLGITEETIPGIEASYIRLLSDLNVHLEQYDYLLGSKPCLADFGLIAPLYAHLYRDPAPGKLMKKHAPAVAQWVRRMINDEPALNTGALLANDQVPDTLLPILQRMAKEQLPVLQDTNKLLSQWRKDNPERTDIDRMIGYHNFTVEGVQGQRVVLPYSLWMFARPVDYYQSLADTTAVDALLDTAGFGTALREPLENHLERPENILSFTK